jgi:hypothetical protein
MCPGAAQMDIKYISACFSWKFTPSICSDEVPEFGTLTAELAVFLSEVMAAVLLEVSCIAYGSFMRCHMVRCGTTLSLVRTLCCTVVQCLNYKTFGLTDVDILVSSFLVGIYIVSTMYSGTFIALYM